MGGLGLGAWLLGRRADRHERPAALYGRLEIAIGVFGLASPLVLVLAHRIYVGTAAALALHGAASVALRFALAGAVLLIPTTLMGGTLPGILGILWTPRRPSCAARPWCCSASRPLPPCSTKLPGPACW